VSLDATRAVWALRDQGKLPGGPQLLVLVALADKARHDHGERATVTSRQLADRLEVSKNTVTAALRAALKAGLIEVVERSRGRVPSVYRFKANCPSQGDGSNLVDNNGTVPPSGTVPVVDNSLTERSSVPLTVPPSGTLIQEQDYLHLLSDLRGPSLTPVERIKNQHPQLWRRHRPGAAGVRP